MGLENKKARKIFKKVPLNEFRICRDDETHKELEESDMEVF
jgi:hypothetical protein